MGINSKNNEPLESRMLLLSIDTSGKSGGITLAEGDEGSFRIITSSAIAGGTFSAQLVPTLSSMLENHGFTANDVGGFVAVSGPGSFTGLRVGLSAIKGLAEVLQKPIATVSLLEALAVSSERQGRIAAALDAGREEIFWGVYDIRSQNAATMEEQLLSHVEFFDAAKNAGSPLVTSDPTIFDLAHRAGIAAQKVERPGSETVARIGLHKLLAGETVGVEDLDENYIRLSDAEIFSSKLPKSAK